MAKLDSVLLLLLLLVGVAKGNLIEQIWIISRN